MKILLVEDDKEISKTLTYFLKEKGIICDTIYDGEFGLKMAREKKYDAIVLDYNLPNLNGLEIVKILRKEKNNIPIIMITVRSELEDKISLLDLGADDYLTKPFFMSELFSRLKAVTRRPIDILDNKMKVADLVLYPDKFSLKKNGKNIKLKAKEFALLEYLMKNKGAYMSRQEIVEQVWDENADPFSNTVEVHIMKLRKKIEDENHKYIFTMPGRGYKIDDEE